MLLINLTSTIVYDCLQYVNILYGYNDRYIPPTSVKHITMLFILRSLTDTVAVIMVIMVTQSYKQTNAQYMAQCHVSIQPCEVCGSDYRIHRHHPDYDKPLEVMFLCSKHHQEWHSKNKAINYIKLERLPVVRAPLAGRNIKARLRKCGAMVTLEDIEYIQSL